MKSRERRDRNVAMTLKKRGEDASVKKKLYYGYGIVIAMMVLVAIMALSSIFSLRRSFISYINGVDRAYNAVETIRLDINIAARNLREMALQNDPSNYEHYKQIIDEKMENFDKEVNQIKETMEVQVDSFGEITHGVNQISGVAQGNAAASQELAANSEEMTSQSIMLSNLVGKFQVGEVGNNI